VWYEQPIYYKANRFSVVGADADVRWPAYAQLLDYELEDTGNVLGPWIVTADEIGVLRNRIVQKDA
jgi:2-keto-4-pentenoate hydratase/2-oxohepta-3-ene-1,7-dioic acid hydratase in catechol pathway